MSDPGGGWSRGGSALGGCLVLGEVPGPGGGGAWSWRGACSGGYLVETPPDGHYCGRYVSYWNAFLFSKNKTTMKYAGGFSLYADIRLEETER